MELRSHVSRSGVQVDVDAPKGQDLAQVMQDVRANYEKIATKNADDLKRWHENQVVWPEKRKSIRDCAGREISVCERLCVFFLFSDSRRASAGVTEHGGPSRSPGGVGRLDPTDTDVGN